MSEWRIALVAEGLTDFIVIEAALKAILPEPFILTLLQPEATRPDLGGGWGGVLKWCREFQSRGAATLESDPTLARFDLFIIHLDADVAGKSYADLAVTARADWGHLPCQRECPPPDNTVEALRAVLCSWLGNVQPTHTTVLCMPAQSTEAWLAAGVYPENATLLADVECTATMESRLGSLPKRTRIKKSGREYRTHVRTLVGNWASVREICSQADVFHCSVLNAIQRT